MSLLDKNRIIAKKIKEGKELSKKEEGAGNDDKKELEEANKELKSSTNKDLILTLRVSINATSSSFSKTFSIEKIKQ